MMLAPRIELVVNAFTTQFIVEGKVLLITDTAELAKELTLAMLECRCRACRPVRLEIEAQVPLRA